MRPELASRSSQHPVAGASNVEVAQTLVVGHAADACNHDLLLLTQLIAEMGGQVEHQLSEAIEALARRDCERARRVVVNDRHIDALQLRIEQHAVATIEVRQPPVDSLRPIVGALRIAAELERIGDLAKNIGKRAATLIGEEMPRQSLRGVRRMATMTLGQLRDVLDSFARHDTAAALAIRQRDEAIDAIYASLFREVLTQMTEDPGIVGFGIHLLFCTKNIERMGDHVANIAEAILHIDGPAIAGDTLARV